MLARDVMVSGYSKPMTRLLLVPHLLLVAQAGVLAHAAFHKQPIADSYMFDTELRLATVSLLLTSFALLVRAAVYVMGGFTHKALGTVLEMQAAFTWTCVWFLYSISQLTNYTVASVMWLSAKTADHVAYAKIKDRVAIVWIVAIVFNLALVAFLIGPRMRV